MDRKNRYFIDPAAIAPETVPMYDFHMHTTWTDGTAGVAEMHQSAIACGLKAILFSEHSRKSSGDWFKDFHGEVRAMPDDRCKALVGTEVKVNDFEGGLDLSPAVEALVDYVIVSVHRFPDGNGGLRDFADVPADEAEDTELSLSLAALDNPSSDILGHPFGMTLRRYRRLPAENRFRALIEKCAARNVAFDVSGRYHPDPWRLIGWCREAGARVVLGSDAHAPDEVGRIQRILTGREEAWNPFGSS